MPLSHIFEKGSDPTVSFEDEAPFFLRLDLIEMRSLNTVPA